MKPETKKALENLLKRLKAVMGPLGWHVEMRVREQGALWDVADFIASYKLSSDVFQYAQAFAEKFARCAIFGVLTELEKEL